MEDPRPEKVAVVAEVKDKLSEARATMLTEYRGLSVSELAELRNALREVGAEYKIYKNTLVRFAARELELPLDDLLTGPNALAFAADDTVGVAKALRDFAKANDKLVIKGGLLGDQVLTADDIDALAKLPTRDELLAKLAGGLAAPMQKMAGLLQALPRNFAYGLRALIDQGGAGDGAADAAPAADDAPAAEAPAGDTASDEGDAPAAEATETTENDESADAGSDTDATEAPAESQES